MIIVKTFSREDIAQKNIERCIDRGHIGLHRIDRVNGHAELGIFIGGRSFHGRGVGKDAIRTLIAHAFAPAADGGLGLFKVWARVYEPNVASRKMCISAGLVEEGFLRGQRVLPEGHLYAAFADIWVRYSKS